MSPTTLYKLQAFHRTFFLLFSGIFCISLFCISAFALAAEEVSRVPIQYTSTQSMTVNDLLWHGLTGAGGVIALLFGMLVKCWMNYTTLVREIIQHTIEMKSLIKALTGS